VKASDERKTPKVIYERLNGIFTFNLDPCTTADNPLCCDRFFTAEDDGLVQPWNRTDGTLSRAFANPPYSLMRQFAIKAIQEAMAGCFVAFILPNDCSTRAFKLLAAHAWGRWEIPFRVKFETPEGKKVDVARSHVVFFLGGLP
jgi:phage N-6-adenine-methyltransferase